MKRQNRNRRHLAWIAARLMIEEGVESYARARRKAAHRLGITDPQFFPEREEIDSAILEHCRLYRSEEQLKLIAELERVTLTFMEQLQLFSPRLSGALVTETALEHSPIEIFLFAENPDDIAQFFERASLDFWQGPTRKIFLGRERLEIPTLELCWQAQRILRFYLFPEEMRTQLSKEQIPLLTLKALRRRIIERSRSGSDSDGGTCQPGPPYLRSSAFQ